jgi:catechol 2,3-dioxygenase-like lactoylglutathione lyase family enzyme
MVLPHTFITAGNFAAARAFYGQLLPFLGLAVVADSVNSFYCVGGRTGFGIHAAAPEFAGQRFRQGRWGYIITVFAHARAATSMRRMIFS